MTLSKVAMEFAYSFILHQSRHLAFASDDMALVSPYITEEDVYRYVEILGDCIKELL